ncbi:regulator of chromosome condensation 1/beta-lactamase-inhibitor protein II [Hyaloraphidium curvatum]|nr:regulator of chromosome condensation 1/beta-lactamase-inhibitor protein II [Hyaloraphidium curvatum]
MAAPVLPPLPGNQAPGDLYMSGANEFDQLGLGPDYEDISQVLDPTRVNLGNNNVLDIFRSCMATFAMIRKEDGTVNVLSCGADDGGVLGRVVVEESDEQNFLPVQGIERSVIQGDAGELIAVIIDQDGTAFYTGKFRDDGGNWILQPGFEQSNTFIPIPGLPRGRKFVKVAVGYSFVILLDETGRAYSFGAGDHGELGRRTSFRSRESTSLAPRGINTSRMPFGDVAANGYHALAISKDHQTLYAWGVNNAGQLGMGYASEDPIGTPTPINFELPEGRRYVDLACGESHSFFKLDDGTWYAMGMNKNGQLGLPICPAITTPTPIPHRMIQISCGGQFTVGVHESGLAWGWGSAETSNLGRLTATEEHDPTGTLPERTKLPGPIVPEIRCIKVVAGSQHTAYLCPRAQ